MKSLSGSSYSHVPRLVRLMIAAALPLAAMAGEETGMAAVPGEARVPRVFSMVLFLMADDSQAPDHWANTDLNFSGLKSGCGMLDASLTKAAGKNHD